MIYIFAKEVGVKITLIFLGLLAASAICRAVGFDSASNNHNASNVNLSTSQKDNVDWTPLFKSWENGCEFSDEYQKHLRRLFYFNNKDPEPFTGVIVLPPMYTNNFENKIERLDYPEVEDGAYTDFSFNVLGGTYHGIPVKKIGYTVGNSHGLSVGYIELTPTDSELRNFLEKVQFKSTETLMYEEYARSGKFETIEFNFVGNVKVERDKITISCDVST